MLQACKEDKQQWELHDETRHDVQAHCCLPPSALAPVRAHMYAPPSPPHTHTQTARSLWTVDGRHAAAAAAHVVSQVRWS